ncbi:MAG: acetyl-CoA hydrolase/transferase family protein [Chloroflexi bacterium]|uniref:4-hydroxybutyrate CoA-transferase n=1 Tax=Candidatus Chlorohelix allophototropha TaxID=3003348 RepID=A0A8T7M172_9CHLR|nr:acetyl-CoA hydrolase/transferase family protein [Chloroflexota bacterium]WJW67598.1 4-hydroxybutyrate CoA-transferase [Chloroflexota bacterium L227-S17]
MYTYVSSEKAVKVIKSGDRVYIHSISAAPQRLINAMTDRAPELRNVEVIHLHTEGQAPYTAPELAESFQTNALFVAPNMRKAVDLGQANYTPVFLSEVPNLFRHNIIPLDVAMVQVSPPDKHGFCSLGISVESTRAAVQMAKHVIAQVNPNMPRTHGDGLVHISEFDAIVECDDPLHEHPRPTLSEEEKAIGRHIAELVEDGATLQMGIGAIPDAVLDSLKHHQRLGVHTEMFSDGVIELVQRGVITGEEKVTHPGKIVAGFVMGTRKLYDFVDDNPLVAMLDIAYINDTHVIRRNPKVAAINSALEVDLTGQVCADSIGTYMYSGVGGQMDFMRGAMLSPGGKPIIALPSVTSKGESRITPFLKEGAGVVTTRAHVHYIVTEYGYVNLYGKNLRQRARMLIDIAHPNNRAALEESAFKRFGKIYY